MVEFESFSKLSLGFAHRIQIAILLSARYNSLVFILTSFFFTNLTQINSEEAWEKSIVQGWIQNNKNIHKSSAYY